MKSKIKRILSIVMTVSMLSTMVPLTTYGADFSDDGTGAQSTVEVPAQNDVSAEEPDLNDGSAQTSDISAGDQDALSSGDEDPFSTDEDDTFSAGDEVDTFSDDAAVEADDALNSLYDITGYSAPELDTDLYKIVFLDCGRKYFSVNSIEKIIDNAAAAGFNYVELGIGNDGLRLLLNDMGLTVNGTKYNSDDVRNAIHTGNEAYYDFPTDELTEEEMNTIIAYASGKGLGIIPLLNTPGHMDAILSAANTLTGKKCSYNDSARTIDVTNATAVAFTQALVQKYIDYFAGKGCRAFNMGADEYANDKYTSGSMGFGNLQSTGKYEYYAKYVNKMADMIKGKRMTPMAFNDGIYFDNNTQYYFDNSIVISYWSNGWKDNTGRYYKPMPAKDLIDKRFNLINTNGDYYWVLGKSDWQCDANKAKDFNYQNFQGGDGLNSLGGMFCIWCDYPGARTEQQVIDATKATITAFGKTMAVSNDIPTTTPPPAPDTTPTPGATETKPITVSVGKTATVTIQGVNYSGETYIIDDPSIATVTVTGTDGSAAQKEYTEEDVNVKTDITFGTNSYSETKYYHKVDDVYYKVYAKYDRSNWNYVLTYGDSHETLKKYDYLQYKYGNPTTKLYVESSKDAVPASTTVTFKGLKTGTTTVTIGNTTYTVNVVVEDLSNVTPQKVELWITNYGVKPTNSDIPYESFVTGDGSRIYGYYVNVSANTAYKEDGIAFESLVPSTGANELGSNLVYWKGTRLQEANKQTAYPDVDQTANGDDFQYIRYWDGEWEFSQNRSEWSKIDNTDQIVAYYLQKTKVTKEVDTLVKDWGYKVGEGDTNSQVGLSVGVVYPDGTVLPREDEIYKNCTIVYNYKKNKNIGIIAPVNNSKYEISKITVTDGKYTGSYGGKNYNNWVENGSIEWSTTTNEAGKKYYNETVVWDESYGTTPVVNGSRDNIIWSDANTAKLILIYLKPVQQNSNLNLVYYDDNLKREIYSTQFVMSYIEGDDEPTYMNSLKNSGDNLVAGQEINLSDDAYIKNSDNINQPINKELSLVPGAGAQYKSGLYEYVKAIISEDGKTLTLHYNIDDTKINKHKYVIDFGLPLYIPLTDIVDSTDNMSIDFGAINNGKAEYISDSEGKRIKYTPSSVLTGKAIIPVKISYQGYTPTTINIEVYPATTVYYEEGFASVDDNFVEKGSTGTEISQTAEKLDSHTGVYGYDDAYKSNNTESSGNALEANQYGAKAHFEFVGDGVDIYLNCTNSTSPVFIKISDAKNTVEKFYTVDTKICGGTSAATNEQNNLTKSYSTPVVSAAGATALSYGTHKVDIIQLNGGEGKDGGVSLDGFRVYNTLDSSSEYASDEQNPQYVELRNKVLGSVNQPSSEETANDVAKKINNQVYASEEAGNDIAAVLLSKQKRYAADNLQDLLENGPKNEIYVYPNEAIVFNLKQRAQIGLKGVNGSTTCTIGTENPPTKQIPTTDMFYELSTGEITISNTGDKVLSITKLKYFGSTKLLFGEISEEALTAALLSMGYPAGSVSTDTPTPTPTQKPENPVKLSTPKLGKVVSESYNSVKVTWSKVKNADGYRVYMKENGKWKYIARVASNSYTRKGLETGKEYTFTVRAYKKTSNGLVLSAYDKKGISGTPVLSAPTLKSAKRFTSGVTFRWNKTAGADGYVVYRKANNGHWVVVAKVKGTTYKDTKAKKGVKYTYTARAYRKSSAGTVYSTYNEKGLSVK